MTPRKRDNKQFSDAYAEAGIEEEDRDRLKLEFHEYKRQIGRRDHLTYQELLQWLREWRYDGNDDADC